MAKATEGRRGRFTREELEDLSGEVLPQRAATSLLDPILTTKVATGLAAAAALPADDVAASADAADVDAEGAAETDES
jgi:hypothetical protein